MSNKKDWRPITRFIWTKDKNGNKKETHKKYYKTEQSFLKDYEYREVWNVNKIVDKKVHIATYKHSGNGVDKVSKGKTYTKKQKSLTYKGYAWKLGK